MSTQPSEGAVRAARAIQPQIGIPGIVEPMAAVIDREMGTVELVEALRDMVNAGTYCIDLMHSAANPKSMDPVDWKGIALHMYASLNVISNAREVLSRHTSTQGKEGKP